MRNHRLIRVAVCVFAALAILVVPAIADELIGNVTAVNVDAKKLTVKEKGTDKDVEIIVTDDTVVEKRQGKTSKVDLEKMQKAVEKSKNGLPVEITHEKNTASKIVYKNMPKKKGDAPKQGRTKKDDSANP